MCYSAMLNADYKKLATDWTAVIADDIWGRVLTQPENQELFSRDDLRRTQIYPGRIAPVIALLSEERIVVPMKYGVNFDSSRSGTQTRTKKITPYNIRLQSFSKTFWKECVGRNHGLVVLEGFFEWVTTKALIQTGCWDPKLIADYFREKMEAKRLQHEQRWSGTRLFRLSSTDRKPLLERKVLIQINPAEEPLIVPVVFKKGGFAIVTDIANSQIEKHGHSRMPAAISREGAEVWLSKKGLGNPEETVAKHRVAAKFDISLASAERT